jgi:chemotaxis family two-component system sensor kinase Cph1
VAVPLRVLSLEDGPDDAELMLYELRRAGFEPDWQHVETESEYLAYLDPAPDIILADYNLPSIDALRALRHLQERGLDIPFIVVTGTVGDEAAAECIKQGATDYLLKDRLARLGQAVAQALEQARLRDKKRQEEQRLRLQDSAVKSAANAIVITDREGRITSVNPAFTRLTGYTAQEAVGETPRLLRSGKHDQTFYRNLWQTVLSGNMWSGEVINRRKDGSLYTEEQAITPVHDERGAISHFIAIKQDITERKQAEAELKRRAAELARSNAELEQFAYVASHDLQDPLRMVASYTQLLAKRYRGKLDSDADEFIAYAVEGATRMQGLINDLLAFSRVGTSGSRREPTDCSGVLGRVLTDLKVTIEESGAVVTHGTLPEVMGDAAQLRQVFQNLISNAIKFRGQEPPRIHVSCERSGDDWLFSVRDNGIGIDPQYADRIFAIFQRLHSKAEYPGTGIGLAICRRVVERQGGRIWLESEPGKGSTFFFTLPVERR